MLLKLYCKVYRSSTYSSGCYLPSGSANNNMRTQTHAGRAEANNPGQSVIYLDDKLITLETRYNLGFVVLFLFCPVGSVMWVQTSVYIAL